jgi:WD40 repeat protein
VAAADGNGMVYIWNLATKRATPATDPDSFAVGAVAFSPSNSYLAAGDSNGHVLTWTHNPQPGDHRGKDSVAIRALAFNEDGKYLAAADLNGNTYIWDTTTWTVVSTPAVQATCGVNGIAFSPDSKYLAAADCDGRLYLWRTCSAGHHRPPSLKAPPPISGRPMVSSRFPSAPTAPIWLSAARTASCTNGQPPFRKRPLAGSKALLGWHERSLGLGRVLGVQI